MTSPSQTGFTLVELAIALMVIGLLIGGVLKGQELIENARVVNVVREVQAYNAAFMIFQSTYGEWPGKMQSPSSRLADCNTDPCNWPFTDMPMAFAYEDHYPKSNINFFLHMYKAGLINNLDTESDLTNMWHAVKQNAFGAYTNIWWTSPGARGNYFVDSLTLPTQKNYYLLATNLAGAYSQTTLKYTMAVDTKMDDGKPQSGTVVLMYDEASIDPANNTYDVSKRNNPYGLLMIESAAVRTAAR